MENEDSKNTEPKKNKTAEEILEYKKRKFQKAKAELKALETAKSKRERKERDTAIFTAGACLLAALEDDDSKVVEDAKRSWAYLAKRYPLLITDHRRQCLNKTSFKLD